MIRIAIVDDDILLLNKTKRFVEDFFAKNKILCEIYAFEKSNLLSYDIHDGIYYDLFLLDIEMPNMDGIALAKAIRKYLKTSIIIFLTSHDKYAIESFELSVFRYVKKGEIAEKLPNALKSAVEVIEAESKDFYVISTRSRFEKIPHKNILYLYKEDKNTVLVTSWGDAKVRKSLNQVYNELNSEEFLVIDRGYIINITQVVKVDGHEVILIDGSRLMISRPNLQRVKTSISTFWREKLMKKP